MSNNETYLVAPASGQLGRQALDVLLKGGATHQRPCPHGGMRQEPSGLQR